MVPESQVPIDTQGPHGALAQKHKICDFIVKKVIDRQRALLVSKSGSDGSALVNTEAQPYTST
jgi:hypothetical protein